MASHLRGAPAAARGVVQYGVSRLPFRGPQRDTGQRFIAVLGGAAAYGRDVDAPWPDLLERQSGIPVVNLSLPQAGLDAWADDPDVMGLVAAAERVVIHLTGAALISNRFYSVHPRRNDRFIGASGALRHLFPEVDFTEFAFVRHMILTLAQQGEARLQPLVAELQAAWSERMRHIAGRAGGRALLLWAEAMPPPLRATLPGGVDFVDQAMISAVGAPLVSVPMTDRDYLITGSGRDLPGPLGHGRIADAVARAIGGAQVARAG